MDLDQFERVLEAEASGASALSRDGYEVGRQLAHLPD